MSDVDLQQVGLGATIAVKEDELRPAAPAAAAAPELARGTLIDRYVIVDKLGAGGMGVVYAAYDPELDRKVAVKLLRVDPRRRSDDARMRLLREAQALAKLSHPNVVAIFDVGTADAEVWLAMEFVEGQTLGVWAGSGRGWQAILAVMKRAGRGLAAAHRAGLVHRDFKPDNVMVSQDGRVRVMDLGLARLGAGPLSIAQSGSVPAVTASVALTASVADEPRPEMTALTMRVTQVGTVLGTPFYMAPEQFHGTDIGPTADVFAFCVTCWEVLFGERPFAGDDVQTLLASIRAGKTRPGPRRSAPAWVRHVLERGLQAEPEDRWPTMDALLAALTRDPGRTGRRLLAAGLVATALVGAGYGYSQLEEEAPCSFAAEELRDVWGAPQRQAVARAVEATGIVYAGTVTATSIGHLDRYSEGWIAAHTAACEDHRRGNTSDLLFDRRMACLRLRRTELKATIGVISQVRADGVDRVVEVAAGIPGVSRCADDERMLAPDPLAGDPVAAGERDRIREQQARAQALVRGGRYDEADAVIGPELAAADRLAEPTLIAELQLVSGQVHMYLRRGDEALAALEAAARQALKIGADQVAAEALTVEVYVLGEYAGRPLDAMTIAGLAEAMVERVGSPPALLGLLHNNVGTIHSAMGDGAGAIAEYERGLELVADTEEPIYWALANNLAVQLDYTGQHARLKAFLPPIHDRFAALNGDCHPFAANMRWVIAMSAAKAGDPAAAIADFERAVQCIEVRLPPMAVELLAALAAVHSRLGDDEEVRRQVARAELLAATSPDARAQMKAFNLVRADVELRAGRWDAARAILAPEQAAISGAGAGSMWQVPYLTRLALVASMLADADGALAEIRRAGELLRPGLPADERALWHFTHARILRQRGAAAAEVAAQLDAATELYRTAGAGFAPRVLEIAAWRAAGP